MLNAQYVDGRLIFLRGTTLMAQRLDVKRLALEAEAEPLAQQIQIGTGNVPINAGAFSVSEAVLVHRGESPLRASFGSIAWAITRDKWIFDVARGLRTRLTFDPADEFEGVWSPDGSRISFNSSRNGREIFFLAPGATRALMAAAVTSQGADFKVGAVRRLFDFAPARTRYSYDVTADGQQIDHHLHICALSDVCEQDGAASLVTQCVEGETLGAQSPA